MHQKRMYRQALLTEIKSLLGALVVWKRSYAVGSAILVYLRAAPAELLRAIKSV